MAREDAAFALQTIHEAIATRTKRREEDEKPDFFN